MTLLQMSLSGGCMILAAMLIRALARERLPGWTFSVLWGAAWLRLMLPMALPSRWSFLALLERWVVGAKSTLTTVAMPGLASSALHADTVVEAPRAAIAAGPIHSTSMLRALSLWTLIWLTGLLLCALAFAASYLRWRSVFHKSTVVDNAFTRAWLAAHPLRRRLTVRQCSAISAPLTYGILRPVILLPETMDWRDKGTLTCAFAHEYAHIRRLDALRKPLMALAPCVHWFNPLAWAMWILANRDIELACDRAAIRRLGAASRRAYALALLRLEERRGVASALTSAFSRNAIEERIGAIMKNQRIKLPALLLAILLMLGVTAAFATTAPEGAAQEAPAADEADYSVYEPFGLVYAGDAGDTYRTNYTYGGQTVRFFNDPVAGASFTSLAGTVDVEAVYEDGRLTGLRECSPEDYDRHTERFERAFGVANVSATTSKAMDTATEAAGEAMDAATEVTGGASEEDWLKEYEPLGVTRDAESGKWLYNGAPIRALIDPEAEAVFRSDDGIVRLAALRNGAGEVYALEELTEAEANQQMLAMDPQGASTAVEAQ